MEAKKSKTKGVALPGGGSGEYKKWRKSETRDGITEEIEVCQVENGFVVEVEKTGTDKKGNWIHEEKKWISKENPLEEEEKSFADTIKHVLDEIAESEGMINVND